MKKLLTSAIVLSAVALSSQTFAATYSMTGSAQGVNVDSTGTVTNTYTAPSANPPVSGTWEIDQANGAFSGNMYLGDYTTYTSVSVGILGSMNGTNVFADVNHDITSGTGSWSGTSYTYSIATGGSNSGIASTYTNDVANSSCTGSGSVFGNTVCGTQGNTTGAWEGITINLDFASDFSSFTGTVTAVETSGSGITSNTATSTYNVAGVSEVPVPAAAWLFGSALVGLAGIGRKRS